MAIWVNSCQHIKQYTEKEIQTVQTSPPCVQMYYYISKYAEEYHIPKNYAFGIAYAETRYEGPKDWDYNQSLISNSGAVGPMQIMPKYAGPFIDGNFTTYELKTDIEMNVKASMRIMRMLFDKHHDWRYALGAYNTGRPCINDYAIKVINYNPAF